MPEFNGGDMVLYTTPYRKFTITGVVSYFTEVGELKVEFPAIGRWFMVNVNDMSDDMKNRLVVVDDDAVFGTDGIRRN